VNVSSCSLKTRHFKFGTQIKEYTSAHYDRLDYPLKVFADD